MTTGTTLPERPTQSSQTTLPEADAVPDEPPPPYEASPATNAEQTLEYGPTRPFQPPPGPPPRRTSQGTFPPPRPPSMSPPTLPPPSFPFWNGSTLTPAQTGFSEGPYAGGPIPGPAPGPASFSPPPHPPPMQYPQTTGPYNPPPASPPEPPRGYQPTETPVPGQPLLHEGKLLVYPPGKDVCWKCRNTGYKPFEPYSGYQGDDPSHPCRKCWAKYGKPYSTALRISLENPTAPVPPNYQRPLRLISTPQTRPVAPNVIGTTSRPHMQLNPNTIVVRPGDPRIGGVLCRRCGGDGTMMGPFIFDEVTCDMCNGAGRVFV
ncbi:hypothetical protein NBRC10513v2_003754 [Rhodotorula toruloides]